MYASLVKIPRTLFQDENVCEVVVFDGRLMCDRVNVHFGSLLAQFHPSECRALAEELVKAAALSEELTKRNEDAAARVMLDTTEHADEVIAAESNHNA